MEELNLTETELRYFGDLFLCCDEESNGKVPVLKATELFRSSNIPNDILKQITDLSFPQTSCNIITHINRKQFYSALKLIAAHQANMSLRGDLLNTFVDLPLPRFTWTLNCEADPDLIQLSNSPTSAVPKEQHIHKRNKSFGSYEPMRLSSNSSDVDIPQVTNSHDHLEAPSTDSEVESETISQRSDHSHTMRANNGSPWSTGSESPTPTNSVAERAARGAQVGVPPQPHHWPHMGEEHTQLLGTEEESSDRHSSEEEGADGEVGGLGAGTGTSVWRVAPDQRRHYALQFQQLQPDSRGLLPGTVARHFFEKSRLPVIDLRKIWLLSDVTKDGALCIEEFTTAMHLVILRRNEIPVPDILPQCLVPRVRKLSTRSSPGQVVTSNLVDLGSDTHINLVGEFNSKMPTIPAPIGKASINEVECFENKIGKPTNAEDSSPSLSPPVVGEVPHRSKPEPLSGNKEWTKFIDSPTSSIASPGPKPVNFDFHKASVERDPKIFHPVPLRVTPEAASLPVQPSDSGGTSPRKMDDLVLNYQDSHDISSPKKLGAQLSVDVIGLPSSQTVAEIKPIQRPQAKKPGLKNIGAIPPPPTKDTTNVVEENSGPMSLQYAPKKEPPPPPPPRPLRTHTRSSSLDLNKLKSSHAVTGIPPQVPPRISPSITSPQSKKLINQRSEGDVLGLLGDPAFDPCDAFGQNPPSQSGNHHPEDTSTETFANFAQFQYVLPPPVAESSAINLPRSRASFEDNDSAPRKHGAFEIYRKPTPRSSESPDALAEPSSGGGDPLKKLQKQNALLCRLCQELSLELADVQRERETLRLRLESTSSGV